MKKSLIFLVMSVLILGGNASANQVPKIISKDARLHYEKAREFETNNNNPLAEDEYRKAIAANKGYYPRAWRDFSFYLSSRLRFSEAAYAVDKYIQQQSGKVDKQERERSESLHRASDIGKKIIVASPTLQALKAYCGLVYLHGKNKGRDSLPFAEKAVSLYPDSSEALTLLATYLEYSSSPNKERRLELLERAISIAPNNIDAFYRLGNYHFFNNPDIAKEYYLRALRISEGTHAESWQGVARIYKRYGQSLEAIEAFKNYLKFSNNIGPYRTEIENEIRELEGKK